MREALAGPELGTVLIAHPGAELYGSDRVMLETLAGLVERRWRVVLAVPVDGPLLPAARDLGAETVVLGVPVLRKALLRPLNLLRFLVGSVTSLRRTLRLVRRLRPDVVYVSTLTIPLWTLTARLLRVPALVHVHESERHAHHLLREAMAAPLLLADRVVANSHYTLESLTGVVPSLAGRSVVVHNGIAAPDAVHLPRAEITGPLRVLYIGRLSRRKGVDVVVDAVAALVREGVDTRLDLVGGVFPGAEGYEEELRRQVHDLDLTDQVRFHGFRTGIWNVLAETDVAVVPARLEESFGNTAIESVLAARPVVVSAIGGLPEAVEGFASAVAVEPDDAAELAHALRRIRFEWSDFRRSAVGLAPVAARRFAPSTYRTAIVDAIESLTEYQVVAPVLVAAEVPLEHGEVMAR